MEVLDIHTLLEISVSEGCWELEWKLHPLWHWGHSQGWVVPLHPSIHPPVPPGQELLPGVCPLMGGTPAGAEGPPGLSLPDGGLGIPASSSTSSAFPAAVSLETGSRKGHHFPVGKVGGQAVQQFLPGRGVDERLWLLCCPAPGSCLPRDPPGCGGE